MSRILRRPMFRGGKVDSRGTGITSGLDRPGYANGPDPSTKVVTGRDIVNQAKQKQGFVGSPVYQLGQGVYEYGLKPAANLANIGANYLTGLFGYPDAFPVVPPSESNIFVPKALNKIPVSGSTSKVGIMNDANASEITPSKALSDEEMQKIFDSEEFKSQAEQDEEAQSTDVQKLIDEANKNEFKGKGDPDSITLSDAEKAKQAKQEYAELLGLEKARMQDAYDMLIRFGGAKGTNFREVAQDFLASEAKAGPSRTEKIKEAAGTLAIKEQIENRQMDKKIAAALAKAGTSQTDMTRIIAILSDPKSSPAAKAVALQKADLQPTLNSHLGYLRSNKGVSLNANDVEGFIKIYKGDNYKGKLISGAKNGVYFSPKNKTLYTFDANGQQIDAEVLNY